MSALRLEVDRVRTLPEAKALRDKAKALSDYIKAQGESKISQDGIGEIRLRIERRLGEMIPRQFPVGPIRGKDKNGKAIHKSSDSTLDAAGISKFQSVQWQAIASIPEARFEQKLEEFKADPIRELTTSGIIKECHGAHVSNNSGQNEWYTPDSILDAARATMGSIDLDPASCPAANKRVKADRFYSVENSGLESKWRGNIWMNPPYAQPLISLFITKLSEEFNAGRVRQACILVNNATDTEWFHCLAANASAICFTRGRVRFIDAKGKASAAPLQGQAIVYIGKSLAAFHKEFKGIGFILKT